MANVDFTTRPIDVIAAGHICLDVIPQLTSLHRRAEDIFAPGALSLVGPASLALGGSVANTGLALHRIGAKTRLVGKVGDDLLGRVILDSLERVDVSVAELMIVSSQPSTSYTIVLSPPNVDRGFLHCPGANDSFSALDLADIAWCETRILHFGYPPLMRGTFADEGLGLAKSFDAAQQAGALVSLDMATPNADFTDWRQWLRNVLPYVDVFMPSLEEIRWMLYPISDENSGCLAAPSSHPAHANLLADISDELHSLGVPIVVIKLGDQGLYLSSTEQLAAQSARSGWKDHCWKRWEQRRLLAPCFEVDVVGTTGSGDCTIAGFLWAMLNGIGPEQALRWASAVGAHCVESADATSNIPPWPTIDARLRSRWRERPISLRLPKWSFCSERGIYFGPNDPEFGL